MMVIAWLIAGGGEKDSLINSVHTLLTILTEQWSGLDGESLETANSYIAKMEGTVGNPKALATTIIQGLTFGGAEMERILSLITPMIDELP